jgi:hypothetical protein
MAAGQRINRSVGLTVGGAFEPADQPDVSLGEAPAMLATCPTS